MPCTTKTIQQFSLQIDDFKFQLLNSFYTFLIWSCHPKTTCPEYWSRWPPWPLDALGSASLMRHLRRWWLGCGIYHLAIALRSSTKTSYYKVRSWEVNPWGVKSLEDKTMDNQGSHGGKTCVWWHLLRITQRSQSTIFLTLTWQHKDLGCAVCAQWVNPSEASPTTVKWIDSAASGNCYFVMVTGRPRMTKMLIWEIIVMKMKS